MANARQGQHRHQGDTAIITTTLPRSLPRPRSNFAHTTTPRTAYCCGCCDGVDIPGCNGFWLELDGPFKGPSRFQGPGGGGGPGSPVGTLGAASVAWTSSGAHDHQQLGPAVAVPTRFEEFPQDRNVAENRDFGKVAGGLVVQQAGDRQVLALTELHLGLGPAGAQGRDLEALDRQAVGEVERRDLRGHLEPDGAVSGDVRSKPQL